MGNLIRHTEEEIQNSRIVKREKWYF